MIEYDVDQPSTDNEHNRLIILSESASFPWGMAASNRVRNLAKALILEGWRVTYLGLRGADISERAGRKFNIRGKSDGVGYFYPGLFAFRPDNWFIRRIDDSIGFLSTLIYLFAKIIMRKVDAILLYSRNKNIAGFFISFLHFFRIPVILEMCEWPLSISETSNKNQVDAKKFCYDIVPKADGILPISTYIDYEVAKVAKIKQREIPSFRIPILIDVEDNAFEKEIVEINKYMLYCGSIAYMDIAMIIIDIVHEIKKRNINLCVKFAEKIDVVSFAKLKKYAQQKGVINRFEFTGYLLEEELFPLMRQATCLLAPLPENPQSISRFPTKIGYYLASATPVVTNAIGDVGLYLRDGLNAFVAPECSASQFADRIETIVNQPALAKGVGLSGRDLAYEKFHYTKACVGLGDFVREVVSEYK